MKWAAYQTWVKAITMQDQNTSTIKKEFSFAFRSFKTDSARVKSEHLARIGE